MAMSNGVTGGVFATLEDLQASKPRVDTQVSLKGIDYTIDTTDFGNGIAVNSLFANPVIGTTTALINSTYQVQAGDVRETSGFNSPGDGGGAQWRATGNTIAASQTPTQTGSATCSDANGNEYELLESFNSGKSLGDLSTSDANIANRITETPIYNGNEQSILTAFDGDFSRCSLAIDHRIEGSDTLTQPATGYVYYPPAYPNYGFLFNTSGHNESLDSNDGRTAACYHRVRLDHNGQGDAVAYNGSVLVRNNKAGSTSFLANPAAVLFNGDVFGGADGVYLNPREIGMADNGFDVAAVGDVIKGARTNNTGDKDVWWQGYRAQNTGTLPWDTFANCVGAFNFGVDLSYGNFGADEAAITLKEGQRVYFNVTATDTLSRFPTVTNDYFEYSGGVFKVVVGNSAVLQVSNGQLTSPRPINSSTRFDVGGNQGATGSFTAQSGETITVTGGIITDIT